MKIAIVGAKERDTEEDRLLVEQLMQQIDTEAPHTVFITMMTNAGVGRFIKDICLRKDGLGHTRYMMVECAVRIYAQNMSKNDMAQIYLARNATPAEMADMMIYLASEDRRGTCEDLLTRLRQFGRPVLVLMPGEPLPKSIFSAVMKGTESVSCPTTV